MQQDTCNLASCVCKLILMHVDFLFTTMLPVVEHELKELEAVPDLANTFWKKAANFLEFALSEEMLPESVLEYNDFENVIGFQVAPVVHAADNFGVQCVS
jgi:hypothetical protein